MSSRSRVRNDRQAIILRPKAEGSRAAWLKNEAVRTGRLLAAVVFLTMCAQQPPPPAPPAATASGPRVIFPDGAVFHVELATDDLTRAQGLMFRDRLRENTGMLFLFPASQPQAFWMKNTLIPLDMVFLDDRGRIVDVQFDVPPCRADPCPGYPANPVVSRYVLEVAAGIARKHGLGPGSVLRLEGLENVVVR